MDWSKSLKQNQNEWRSITPEREFGILPQAKQLITEPTENKQTAKSLSQENNSNKSSINRLLAQYENQQSKFSKPLTHMKSSIKKLSEIGQQINSIITQCKQNSITRIQRPQSDQNVFEKNSMMKKSSQNDISLSTNINLNHSYVDNRGTETERSYLYYKIQKESMKFQKKPLKEQNKSLKKLIEKKIAPTSSSSHDVYADYLKLIQKQNKDRSQNIQKYINLKFLRNSQSGVWSNDKSDNNKRMSSYYTQNHYSKSHSSFLNERENSKSENTTSRNNRIRVSSYIKTPTKNSNELIKQLSPRFISQQLSSYQVSSSKINSLLSSVTKDIDKNHQPNTLSNLNIYHLQTIPLFIQNDPNQTHIIVCNSDLSVRAINLYSGRIALLGKHNRPIKSISKVVLQQNCKIFYTSSQDGQIIQWISESMHGTYKLMNSWRMSEPPLQLYQTDKGILYIITANHLYYYSSVIKKEIPFTGVVKCLIQTPLHILVAVDDIIYKLQAETLIPQIQLQKLIQTMIYEDAQIYVLTKTGNIIILSDSSKITFLQEINLCAINLFNMNNGLILAQTGENELIILHQSPSQKFQIDGKISCLLACSQILLIGSNKKIIETIKL